MMMMISNCHAAADDDNDVSHVGDEPIVGHHKSSDNDQQDDRDIARSRERLVLGLKRRLYNAKLDLWARGDPGPLLDETYYFGSSSTGGVDGRDGDDSTDNLFLMLEQQVLGMEAWSQMASRQSPIQRARYSHWKKNIKDDNNNMNINNNNNKGATASSSLWTIPTLQLRGGGGGAGSGSGGDTIIIEDDDTTTRTRTTMTEEMKMKDLTDRFGSAFVQAIEQNIQEHRRDCEESCEVYYCAPPHQQHQQQQLHTSNDDDSSSSSSRATATATSALSLTHIVGNATTIRSYSMGAVPPEDFAADFGFPLDLIKVTQGRPLFSREEALSVIRTAEDVDGVHTNEFKSGKYRLGGDWLTNLPKTREWFNEKLERTFFPLLAHLFPEIVSDVSVLRAHSVSLLKYNSSHPRTDVHIDNGILAMTIAMTPQEEYTGGGTFFEHFTVANQNHLDNDANTVDSSNVVIPMDVGHGTFRPGSVRHGGHRVTAGTRYILGAFLLLEDKVEHVRRLKNRGSELRRMGDLTGAAQHFEWALAMNPKCTTCLKDWAEILHTEKRFDEAEAKIRQALELLEYKDSDALFTLGILLSEQGKDEECIRAYRQSLVLNQEDAELLYNLGVKLGEQSQRKQSTVDTVKEEMTMYAMCTKVDPTFGGAWLNWGTTLAEQGNLDDAEIMFLKAVQCDNPSEVKPKAMVNLALIYYTRAGQALQLRHDVTAGKAASLQAATYLDAAKPLLDIVSQSGQPGSAASIAPYLAQYKALRLGTYRNLGQIYAGGGDMVQCESEFRKATETFPQEIQAWQMLGRVLELQGKVEEMEKVVARIQELMQ